MLSEVLEDLEDVTNEAQPSKDQFTSNPEPPELEQKEKKIIGTGSKALNSNCLLSIPSPYARSRSAMSSRSKCEKYIFIVHRVSYLCLGFLRMV